MATKKTSRQIAQEIYEQREKANQQNRTSQLKQGLNNIVNEVYADREKIGSLLSDYETEYNNYINSYNERFTTDNGYRGDASGALRGATETVDRLAGIETEVKQLIEKWGSYLDDDYVSGVNDFFSGTSETNNGILDTYKNDFQYMSQFNNEKEYSAREKRRTELEAYDLETAEKELKELQGYLKRVEDGSYGKRDLQMVGFANEQVLRNAIQEKTDEINNYKIDRVTYGLDKEPQSALSLSFPQAGKTEPSDKLAMYDTQSAPITAITNPSAEAFKYVHNDTYRDVITEMTNEKATTGKVSLDGEERGRATNITYYKANPQLKFDTFATDAEKAIYDQLLREEGRDVADAYRASIDSELNERATKAVYELRYEDDFFGKVGQAATSGLSGSITNMATYVDSAIRDLQGKPLDIEVDLDQLQFAVNSQNSSKVGKFVLDAINTTTAQLPAIAAGMTIPVVGGAIGQAAFFGSAAGGALREAKQKGYTDEQAMIYANLVGASELLVERFLGAVPGVGKMSGKISNFTLGLDNALLRVASQMGLSALSEFTEESLQSIIEPALAALVEGSSYDAPTWEEVLYSGLLGAVTGMGFGGVTAVSNNAIQTDLGNKIISTEGAYTDLVGLGKTMPEGSAALKMATDLSSIEGKPNANKVGRLYQAVGDSLTKGDVTSESKYKEITNRVKTASQKALDNALDTKELTNESKEQAKTMYKPLSGVDPNSEEAIAHAENFVEDFETAVMAGRVAQETGETIPDLINEGHVTTLTEEQTKAAIDSGRIEALESQQKKTISTEQKSANYNKMISRSIEQINADSKADTTLTTVQKTAVRIAEKLNTALGFYNSADLFNEQRDGIAVKKEGGKKVLFLDRNTTDPVRQVFVHELAHFSENTKSYTKLAKAIKKSKAFDKWLTQNGFEGKSLSEKMSAYRLDKKTQYQEHGENLNFEEVNAEMIANFLGETFGTEEAFDNFMSELNTQDKRTVVDFLKDVVAWLKSTFKGDVPSELKNIERMYQKALKESAKDNKTVSAQEEVKMANDGIVVDDDNNVAWSLPYSFANIKNVEERKAKIEEYAKALHEVTGRSIEDCRKWIENETSLVAEIMTDPEMLSVASYEADDRYEAIKTNSDYPQGTVDMSNLCPKRSVYTWLVDKLQNKYPNKIFNAETLAKIRGVLDSESIQVACALCYVEDRRQLVGEVADTYINMWKDAAKNNTALAKTNSNGERKILKVSESIAATYGDILGVKRGDEITVTDRYIPNQYDLTTYEGFKKLQVVHPQVAMGFELYNNSRGQQAVRLIEGRAEYKRQILEWSDEKVKKINDLGGLRMFSFSDFEVAHLVDMVQIILDCSARGVKIQCYTKIPGFAKLVRDTGIKLNRSLIPKGNGVAVVNGKKVLVFDNVEGINTEDVNFLDERDNANIGNVLVGINGEQIKLAMLDDNIDYIIPFHTNKAQKVLNTLGIGEWNNYKNSQHDKNKATGKAASSNINIYTEVIDAYNPQNKVEFVEAFLRVAKEKNIIPRFSEFLNTDANGDYVYTEGYHKFLVDFKLFDKYGNILPQQNIVPDLDPQFMRELIASEVEKNKDTSQYEGVFEKIDKEFGEVQSQTQFSIPLKKKEYAPTFYSQMGKVVEGVKQDKLAANSVVNMLRGKGVKAEEIKWSGIEQFLDGKKSVTKQELLEFINGSMLQIGEEVRSTKKATNLEFTKTSKDTAELYAGSKLIDTFTRQNGLWVSDSTSREFDNKADVLLKHTEEYGNSVMWDEYKLKGGKNYRELVLTLPNSTYTNPTMQTHWGEQAKGILAHARVQDFRVKGKKMLFVEELQSDYHNEGHKEGYTNTGARTDKFIRNESANAFRDFYNSGIVSSMVSRLNNAGYFGTVDLFDRIFEGDTSAVSTLNEELGELTSAEIKFIQKTINEEKARKNELLSAPQENSWATTPDAPFKDTYQEFVMKRLIRMAAEEGYDSIGWTTADIQSRRWSDEFAEGYRIEYDQDIPKFLKKYGKQWGATVGTTKLNRNTEVWSMDITDSMKNSVLYEGQAMYSIPERAKKLQQDFADGKITHAELVQEEARLMDEARKNYGTIEEGENAVNKTKIPTAVEDSKKINRFVRTITETGSVDAKTANALGEKLLLGELSHKVASDEEAISTAEKSINNGTAEESWSRTVNNINKMPSKNDLAIGERLLAEALNSSNSVKALTIASDLADAFTRAGQWVQAASLLKKMTGPGMLIHLQKTVNKLNGDMTKRYGDKYPLLQMPENLATELAQATTQEDVEAIAEEIMQDLADQSPVTFLDKWNAWRYLSMLGNPLTHFRNLIGNAVFMPATMMRYETAALLEQALPTEERTKSVKVDEKYMNFAKQDSKTKEAKKMLNMSDKMTGESGIARKRKIFKTKWLNGLYELNGNLLGGEDAIFKTAYYTKALAGYLQAKNIDLETITEEQLTDARNYATEEALKNTYNDVSDIALYIKGLEKKGWVASLAVNGLIPFKQTPINIIKRGVEYSPIGLMDTLTRGVYKLKKGDITATQFIDGLSAGGSGTVTFGVGMLLAAIGAASGGFGDDDEDKFKKLAGDQEYALRIGGKTYTLDWAAPMCIPFFMGVEFVNSVRKSNADFTISSLGDTFWHSLDPLVNMSMLSGLESAIRSTQGTGLSKTFGAVGSSVVTSYLGQAVPTIGGKLATVVDEYRRTNYVDKNIPVPAMLQKLYNSTIAKVPFLSKTRTKYIDAWGREVSQGNIVERVAESFFSPGYMSTLDYTDVDLEILELYENTGDNGVFPDNAPKYFTVKKERVDLTAKEYETFAKAKGQYSFEYVREFFESDYYDQMSDAERVKVLKKLYEYATDKAKAEVSAYNVEENNKLAYKTDKEGKSVVEYYANNVLSERYEPKLYNDALESASIKDAEKLKTDIIAWKVKNGSTEKEAKSSLRSSVTSYWKPKYLEAYASGNEAEMDKIREKLAQSDLYGSDRQLNSTLNDWEEKYEEGK